MSLLKFIKMRINHHLTEDEFDIFQKFIELFEMEDRTYIIQNCSVHFINYLKGMFADYDIIQIERGEPFTITLFAIKEDNKPKVLLKATKESFQKRIDFLNKSISDFIED